MNKKFFEKNTLDAARELLGKVLCVKSDGKVHRGIIVETEAYTQEDPACHAYCGMRISADAERPSVSKTALLRTADNPRRTKRSQTLFEKPGTIYVYLIYGMHYCVNIVTEKEGYGAAVLIRALEPLENLANTNGPAKLCKAANITKEFNGAYIFDKNSPIWLEDGEQIPDAKVVQTTRIGIKKAADYKWRFYIKDNEWVSKL